MFSTKLTRVAHRAPAVAVITNAPAAASAHLPATCTAARRPHQRRHSSSKTSCPPASGPSGSKPAPATKAGASAPAAASGNESAIADATVPPRPKRVSRVKRSRSSAAPKAEDQFAGLPAVQNTKAWRYNDFSTSSFFSLHRPLSLTTQFPRTYTADEFAAVFDSKHSSDPWANGNSAERRPEDVVYALFSPTQELDGGFDGQDGNASWELADDSRGSLSVKQMDGQAPTKSLDRIIAHYQRMPFEAPPPPQPFPQEKPSGKKRQGKARTTQIRDQLDSPRARERSFQATITVTERASEYGPTILIAERGPFVQVEDIDVAASADPQPIRRTVHTVARQSPLHVSLPNRPRRAHPSTRVFLFVESMRVIRNAPTKRVKMILISVKRQRKLKMKKHKYKKLMKKTRNLRRRQDRA